MNELAGREFQTSQIDRALTVLANPEQPSGGPIIAITGPP